MVLGLISYSPPFILYTIVNLAWRFTHGPISMCFFSRSIRHRYEVLFAPQPSASSCKFLTSIEMAFQHQVAETNERMMHQAERLKAEATSVAASEEQLEEIEHCILVFLRENADPGSLSLAGIIVSALCALCRLLVLLQLWLLFTSYFGDK